MLTRCSTRLCLLSPSFAVLLYIGSKIIKNVLFFIIGVCVCVRIWLRIWHHIRQGRGEANGATRNETQPSYFFTTIFFFVAAPPLVPVVVPVAAASAAAAHFLYSVSNSSRSRVHNA